MREFLGSQASLGRDPHTDSACGVGGGNTGGGRRTENRDHISGSARYPSACVLFVLSLAQSSPVAKCEAKSHDALSRRPASSDPRFSIGPRGTSPGGFSERARVSQPFPRLWRVSGPPWTTPRRPAGEHHEHSGARNRPCGTRRGIANFLSG